MAATYPTTKRTYSVKVPGTKINAEYINSLQEEIEALENQLIISKLASLAAAPSGNQVLTSIAGAPTWAAPDGWTPATGAWTINAAATGIINVPDSSVFGVGNPIKLTNSTVKQFYVIAIPSGTTITVSAGSSFALVGAAGTALTACYYSKMSMPTGFPQAFNWIPTVGATSPLTISSVTVHRARFYMVGTIVHIEVKIGFTLGGTAGTNIEMTLPILLYLDGLLHRFLGGGGRFIDSVSNTGGYALSVAGSNTTVWLQRDNGANWVTGAGAQLEIQGSYPA